MFLLLIPRSGFSQPGPSGLQDRNLTFTFRQDFNNYIWTARLRYVLDAGQRGRISLSDRFNSNLLRTESLADKWKDDHQLGLRYEYRWREAFVPLLVGQSVLLSDKQSGFQNSLRTHVFGAGFRWTPRPAVKIESLFGWKADRRFSLTNRGWHARVEAFSSPFEAAGYTNLFSASWSNDRFQRYSNRDFSLSYRVHREFYPGTADTLIVRLGRHRRSYYIATSGDFETRRELANSIGNRLRYGLGRHVSLHVLTALFSRRSAVSQVIGNAPTGRRERRDSGLELTGALLAEFRTLRGRIEWNFLSQNQSFLVSEGIRQTPFIGSLGVPDNLSRTQALRTYLHYLPSRRDSLTFAFFVSRLRYDTPDSNNFDDRDELRISSGLSYSRRISGALLASFSLRANLHHLVYLFSQRSANNNWNRILQLANEIEWQPGPISRLKQRAEVLANYTSYDFEAVKYQIRSFVYRKFTLTDSLRLGRNYGDWQWFLFHRLELEENGRLFWQDFAEQPLVDRRNHYLAWGVQKRLLQRFFVYFGVAAYLRKEWRYRQSPLAGQIREHYGDFLSWGPQFRVFLLKNGGRVGLVSVSNFRVTPPQGSAYRIMQVDLNAHWYF